MGKDRQGRRYVFGFMCTSFYHVDFWYKRKGDNYGIWLMDAVLDNF